MKKLLPFILCFSSSLFCMQPGQPPAQLVPPLNQPKSMLLDCCNKTAEGVSYGCDKAGELGNWCCEPITPQFSPFSIITSLATFAGDGIGGHKCAAYCCGGITAVTVILDFIGECRKNRRND